MNLNQGDLSQSLTDEILELIRKYDGSLYLPTVLGALELIKLQLIAEHIEEVEDE
jgi:hypothetical protein